MKIRVSVILFFIATASWAQQIGNEWINFDQEYIKLKIAETGFYRVSSSELQSAGFPVGSVAAEGVRLYRKGREVAIRRVTNSDGVTLNYFDFYAEDNDGERDSELYRPGAQVEPELNLFTDTAAYFVTWTTTASSRRITQSAVNDNTGLVPESFLLSESELFFKDRYHVGARVEGIEQIRIYKYDFAEGLGTNNISRNQFREFNFSLTNPAPTGELELEISLIGINSRNHNVRIEAGSSAGNTVLLPSAQFPGRTSLTYTTSVDISSLSVTDNLYLRATVLGDGAEDVVAISKVQVKYPALTIIDVGENAVFELPENPVDRSYIRFSTPTPAEYEFFDITDPFQPVRLQKTELSNRADVVVPSTSSRRKVAAVRSFASVPVVEASPMSRITNAGDYLIVYHQLLNTGGAVDQYAAYRESEEGGGYTVSLAEIHDIYDQFNYGDPSPLAIRNLFRFGANRFRFGLIIGYGYTPNIQYYRNYSSASSQFRPVPINIPTYGEPGGDMPFSMGLDPQNEFVPAIPIGRLNVLQESEIINYLDKIRTFESLPFNSLRRKRVLQLSGGQTAEEIQRFRSYVQSFESQIEGDFLGGSALNYSKSTTAVSETFNISNEVNEGVGLITLFGHSSSTVTDIEIGKVSDPDFGYTSQELLPIILVNGCNAGDIFGATASETFGEDWISTPDKGAVAFMANAGFALSTTLRSFSVRFYDVTFLRENLFGRTLGESLTDVARELLRNQSELNQVQVGQLVLQGDPAVRPFGADKPDFETSGPGIQITGLLGDDVFAQDDRFLLRVAVRNFGKTSRDSLSIRVNRASQSGVASDTLFTVPSVRFSDTLEFVLANSIDFEGLNTFTVTVDSEGLLDELSESNNTAQLEYNFIKSRSSNLLPVNYSVVGEASFPLLFQNVNLIEGEQSFQLEVAIDGNFEQPLVSQTISGEDLYTYQFSPADFDLTDSTTLFWRTRLSNPVTAIDSVYAESSFTWIEGAPSSWGIFAREQLQRSTFSNLSLSEVDKDLIFQSSANSYDITTAGSSIFDINNLVVTVDNEDIVATNTSFDACELNSINFLFFDSETSQLKRPVFFEGADVLIPQLCGRLPQRIHNLTQNDVLGAGRWLDSLIAAANPGDKVVMFTMDSVSFSSWDAEVISSLQSIGIDAASINSWVDGQPIIAVGEKGFAPGEALVIQDNGTAQDIRSQEITATGAITGLFSAGSFTSPRLGPAVSWGNLNYQFLEENSEDSAVATVILVDQLGNQTVFDPPAGGRVEAVDLSSVNAAQFPFIRVQFAIEDQQEQTAPSFDFFTIDYQAPPEGALLLTDKSSRTVQEGEEITTELKIVNISNIDFTDSLDLLYRYRNQVNGRLVEQRLAFEALAAGDTQEIQLDLPTIDYVGQNELFARFSYRQLEQYLANNFFDFRNYVEVTPDQIHPVLDVKIDGRYIASGDVVSASPEIFITLKDENRILLPADTSNVRISLRRPEGEFEPVYISNPQVSFAPASPESNAEVLFTPGPLTEGMYTLRVNATDETGNAFASEPYEISFEVVSSARLTDFFTYPNPMTTSCRFVFRLTGPSLPEVFKIEIANMTGRVVKEIDLLALGEVNIGNNITQYSWDGRSNTGALLPGGLYLYRVFVEMAGETIELQSSSSSSNGFGKLFILR